MAVVMNLISHESANASKITLVEIGHSSSLSSDDLDAILLDISSHDINLHDLNIEECNSLTSKPLTIGQLIHLQSLEISSHQSHQHLDNSSIYKHWSLPLTIGELINLKTSHISLILLQPFHRIVLQNHYYSYSAVACREYRLQMSVCIH